MELAENMSKDSERRNSLLRDTVFTIADMVWGLIMACVAWILPRKYKNIEEEVVLVTGGGRGLGRLLAVELAKYRPKHIILWGRNEDTLGATAKAIRLNNVACSYMVCDVADYEMVRKKAQEVEKNIGRVTMLINNAGIVYGNPILTSKPEEVRQTFETNTLSHFWTVQAFLPHMLDINHGHIVSINSMLGFLGLAGAAGYSASKHGTYGFSESLKMELLTANKPGIIVTSIHPYLVNTEMFAGCTTRFPSIFPPLDKEYVIWRCVDAILRNQTEVLIPRVMYFFVVAQRVLPSYCLQVLQKFTGVHEAMLTFHAHTKKKT